jgi:plasmid maintenance system antidote protein VapI
MGITQYRLAKAINVSPRRINVIAHGKRGISINTALKIGAFLWRGRAKLDQPANRL